MVHGPVPAPSGDQEQGKERKWSEERPDVHQHPPNHRSGSMIQALARQVGSNPRKVVKDASMEVYATPEERGEVW